MKCKLCHKNVRNIGHWAREHKAWLKSRPRKRRTHRTPKGPRVPRTSHPEAAQGYSAPLPGHYCPVCGRQH